MGKWTSLMANRPVYQSHEPRYQDKVDEVKTGIRAQQLSPSTIAQTVATLREKKAQWEAQLATVQLQLEAHHQMLIDIFDEAGLDSLKLKSGQSVRTQIEPYAAVKDKVVFKEWCHSNGYSDLMTLPWQTTNSITKDRLQEGEPEPDGVEVYARTKVVLSKKAGS